LATPALDLVIRTTDSGGGFPALSFSQTFTITVVFVPSPPAVSDTVMSVDENSLSGTIVGAITMAPGADATPLNFTINTALSPAGYNMFRVQLCSGTFFVNSVLAFLFLFFLWLFVLHPEAL
jgi:hypothetical protein